MSQELGWIDTHTHLCDQAFDNDLENVMLNLKNKNVSRVLVVCLSFEELEKGYLLKEKYPNVDLAFGIFPTEYALFTTENKIRIEEIIKDDRIVALGEIGLDYYWEKDEEKILLQKEIFNFQIDLAKKYHKPIIIHSRDACADTLKILKEKNHYGIMHCFSYSLEVAKEFVDIGYYISLAGPVTFKNAKEPKRVAKEIDLNYLLIETDSPYLTPEPNRGKRNESSNVSYIGEYIAKLKNMENEELMIQLNNNYNRLFKRGKINE
ncbi:MAG: TatD family hydrolase [Anaerorhabdus sp.]